jgi:hypothetical protein
LVSGALERTDRPAGACSQRADVDMVDIDAAEPMTAAR